MYEVFAKLLLSNVYIQSDIICVSKQDLAL